MSTVERASPLASVTPVKQRATPDDAQTAHKNIRAKAEASAQVKLSDAQERLMLPGNQDIDRERVKAIRERILNDELPSQAEVIAGAILATQAEVVGLSEPSV